MLNFWPFINHVDFKSGFLFTSSHLHHFIWIYVSLKCGPVGVIDDKQNNLGDDCLYADNLNIQFQVHTLTWWQTELITGKCPSISQRLPWLQPQVSNHDEINGPINSSLSSYSYWSFWYYSDDKDIISKTPYCCLLWYKHNMYDLPCIMPFHLQTSI